MTDGLSLPDVGALPADQSAEEGMWIKPEYSREEVNRAVKTLARAVQDDTKNFTEDEWATFASSYDVINNWRSSHGYPLFSLRMNLTRVANRLDRDPLIAQRIKRFWSISHKLLRMPDLKLTQMQDLGGCRAILSSVSRVKAVVDYHVHSSSVKHGLSKISDYITEPKESGYRGVHMVYQVHSDNPTKKIYNGHKIEMHLRSIQQHAWATTVETVGTFSGQALKSSLGNQEWLRFFVIYIAVFSISPIYSPRYFYPVYVVWAAALLSSPRSVRVVHNGNGRRAICRTVSVTGVSAGSEQAAAHAPPRGGP